MADPLKHLHHLAVEIGPRGPTTAAEAQASDYAQSVLEASGSQTTVEPFDGVPSFGNIYIPTTAAMLAGALIATRKRPLKTLGVTTGALGLASFWGENTTKWRAVLERIPKTPSQNVVGVIKPKGEPRRRLVVVAHIDSSRSGLMFHPKLTNDFRRSAFVGIGAAAASLASYLLPRKLRRSVATAASAVIAANLGMLIQREVYGRDVHGANDNASGASIVLSLAEHLASEPLTNTEVWCVLTGCEESDLVGMSAFVDRHQNELADAYFLNLDTVAGAGSNIRWIVTSSLLDSNLRADGYLVKLAEQVSLDHPGLEAEPGTWHHAGLDGDVAAVRGMRAMSLVAQTPQGTLPNWHWPTDTYENIDEAVLQRSFNFTRELVTRFDSQS